MYAGRLGAVFIGLVGYLLIAWMITFIAADASAVHNGPCLTIGCPEGEPSDWVLLVPATFLVGFVFLAARGLRWARAKPPL